MAEPHAIAAAQRSPGFEPASGFTRWALGLSYRGQHYHGWQSQADGRTVQDALQAALAAFATVPLMTVCAGRTDSGVHALNQVVHIDTRLQREPSSWVRGTNRFLPRDIAVQWAQPVSAGFHARNSARGRCYRFVVLQSPVRPALEHGLCGWSFRPLDGPAMRLAARHLLGEHDFTSFRAADCQSPTPIKTLRAINITQRGAYWCFDFDANAFLHHMVRNLMGSLLMVGTGRQTPGWMADVLAARSRALAAPTFPADGLYFVGPYYDAAHAIPGHTAAMEWIP